MSTDAQPGAKKGAKSSAKKAPRDSGQQGEPESPARAAGTRRGRSITVQQRKPSGDRRSGTRAGQAVEPPPTIRPKVVPQRAAAAKPIKTVGPGAAVAVGGPAADEAPAVAGATEVAAGAAAASAAGEAPAAPVAEVQVTGTTASGKPKRSFRTAKQTTTVTTVDSLDDEGRVASPAEAAPSYAPSAAPQMPPSPAPAVIVPPRSTRAHVTTAADVQAAAEAAQAAHVAQQAKEAAAAAAAEAAATAATAAATVAAETAVATTTAAAATASLGGVRATGKAKSSGPRGARKIKLHLSYISPLSVMKMSFLLSICIGIGLVVMVYVLWNALDAREVFVKIDDMITQVVGDSRPKQLDILAQLERGRIMSGAT
ncbi:MAG: DUF3566 domain-containing protein, partial [Bifidobacteriaceae bacterium]|nr:DUF3566 domain-containing protein [Bifidobacteriaceae bacterium]